SPSSNATPNRSAARRDGPACCLRLRPDRPPLFPPAQRLAGRLARHTRPRPHCLPDAFFGLVGSVAVSGPTGQPPPTRFPPGRLGHLCPGHLTPPGRPRPPHPAGAGHARPLRRPRRRPGLRRPAPPVGAAAVPPAGPRSGAAAGLPGRARRRHRPALLAPPPLRPL